MTMVLVSVLWVLVVGALIAHALGQSRRFTYASPDARPTPPLPSIAVVVPARDEAGKIGRCLGGLLAQTYPADRLTLTVVDDGSTDATARIVEGWASRAAHLSLVRARRLPRGWLGKPHACWTGARRSRGDWLCFIDADTCPAPELLAAAAGIAEGRQLDLLSLEPRQELGGFWERLVLPAGYLLLAFFEDVTRFDDPGSAAATANGQFILIRRAVYEAVGGHRAVRGEIAEDKRLAERVKRSGHRVALLGGDRLISARMYTGLAPLWQGLSKHAADLADGVGPLLLYSLAGLTLALAALALPAWCWTRALSGAPAAGEVLAAALFGLGTLAFLGLHAGTLHHFRAPPLYALLAPLAFALVAAIAVNCVRQRATGRTVWKGRVYALPGRPGRGTGGTRTGRV